jgi:hypothetical protein
MASIGMTFIPNFIKISHLVQTLREGTQTQHGDLISLLFFLRKESRQETGL